jgi:predicted DNA-binding transcriptional regulator AlpA
MKLLSRRQLRDKKGLPWSDDQLTRKARDPSDDLPKPIVLSNKRVAYVEAEVDAWIAELSARRSGLTVAAA